MDNNQMPKAQDMNQSRKTNRLLIIILIVIAIVANTVFTSMVTVQFILNVIVILSATTLCIMRIKNSSHRL